MLTYRTEKISLRLFYFIFMILTRLIYFSKHCKCMFLENNTWDSDRILKRFHSSWVCKIVLYFWYVSSYPQTRVLYRIDLHVKIQHISLFKIDEILNESLLVFILHFWAVRTTYLCKGSLENQRRKTWARNRTHPAKYSM